MGGRALKQIEKKAGGFVAKSHLLPPPSARNRGGEGRSPAAPGRRPGAMVADGRRGKRGMEARGFDPPLDFEGGGPQGGEPWRRAEAVSGRRGGDVVGPGGGRS